MTAMQQVKSAVIAALQSEGLAALGAYSVEMLKRYETAVAAVGVQETAMTHSGALEYLGERYDEQRGTPLEVYGRKMQLSLSLNIFAPRALEAEGCEAAAETVTQAMMTALPCGLKLRELNWAEVRYDKVCGLFRLDARAKYDAYFVAETAQENAVFTDFILRGVVQNHD